MEELAKRRAQHLFRTVQTIDQSEALEVVITGRRYVNFCSNDYLGLSQHPDICRAYQRGIDQNGAGSGAAHLITGHRRAHQQLEEALAEFTGYPRALLFSTGYMANLAVVTALLKRGDCLYQDRLNHASLLDAGILSRARLIRYEHLQTKALVQQMQAHTSAQKMVACEGVFSMDGDLSPLPEIVSLCDANRAWLYVDDAHGFGVLGKNGRGSLEHHGLSPEQVPIFMGTLGKALGTFGAFVASSNEVIDTIIQQGRSYIYTTATPAAMAEATRASLRLLQTESWRREILRQLVAQFRTGAEQLGLPIMPSSTAIQPLLVGPPERALALSETLRDAGFLVSAIRPPTVPENTSRLRITLSAGHSSEQVERLLEALASAMDTVTHSSA